MQEYVSLCAVVTICATWLTHRLTHSQRLTGYALSSASQLSCESY